MQTIYVAESKNYANGLHRIKFTSDRDCLSPDVIRTETRVFADDKHIMDAAYCFAKRGFEVCIDTETMCDEITPYFGPNGTIEGTIHK